MTEPSGNFEALRYAIGYIGESNEDSINCCDGDSARGMFIVPSLQVTNRPSDITSYILSSKNTSGKLEWVPNYLKRSVRVASVAPVDLDTVTVIDGVALTAGDRVLLRDQVDTTENGIYTFTDPGLTRAKDALVGMDASLITIISTEGAINSLALWTTTDTFVLFGDPLTIFNVIIGSGGNFPGNPNRSVQFNDAGTFGGSADLIWNGTDLTVAQPVLITDTTNSTSSVTGALIVSGGVGIAQDFVCAGSVSGDSFITTSDRNLKKDILPIVGASRALCGLKPVQYRLKGGPNNLAYGLIAQDLVGDPLLGDLVRDHDSHLGLDYNSLVGLLVASQRELIKRIENIEKKIKS